MRTPEKVATGRHTETQVGANAWNAAKYLSAPLTTQNVDFAQMARPVDVASQWQKLLPHVERPKDLNEAHRLAENAVKAERRRASSARHFYDMNRHSALIELRTAIVDAKALEKQTRLKDAAPELKRALLQFMATYATDEDLCDQPHVTDCWKLARAALSKARGE